MIPEETRREERVRRWLPWSGLASVIGAILVIGTPWVQAAVLGTRPYATSAFDVSSFAGWVLMAVGLVGVCVVFTEQFDRLGRGSVTATAVGMTLLSALSLRRVALFADAGFRAVPATGEAPSGLLLSIATVCGLGLAVLGTGGIGLALRRVEDFPAIASWLLVLAPTLPGVSIGVDRLVGLPVPVGRLLVSTNVVLVPFALSWTALGLVVLFDARSASDPVVE